MNERDEALREALRTDALEDVHADLAEAQAAVQRIATLAAQRSTALAEMQRERDEAQRQLSEMVDRSLDEGWKQVGYDIERQERYRLAWTSARQRAANHLAALIEADEERDFLRQLSGSLDSRLNEALADRDKAQARASSYLHTIAASENASALEETREEWKIARRERDEARAEVVRLGRELEQWKACFGEDEFRARGNRLIDALSRSTRPWTDDERSVDADGRGFKIVTVKRCCNGCGDQLGDANDAEIEAGMSGRPLPDVRAECFTCTPLAPLTDEQLEERVGKIKQTAAERVEARRLRAALDEERIEPGDTP